MHWKKSYVAHSSRVKALDIHPTQPWVVTGLYAGHLAVYDYTNYERIHKIEVCNAPIRCCKFVADRDWIISGNDEGLIFVHNALTQERLRTLSGHSDYVRCIAVHPSLPLMLSCADDMEIHCWNLDTLTRVASFVGHQDYVMQIAWAPRNGLFASCSLDGTIKFWSIPLKVLNSISDPISSKTTTGGLINSDKMVDLGYENFFETITQANFTLVGHDKGVNGIQFSRSLDKPYIISGSDDYTVKIWDYQTRQCLQTLFGHESNVSHAIFHPYLPIILSCCESGIVKIWNSSTYKCIETCNLDMGRLWLLDATINSVMNDIAVATDEGLYMATIGRNRPLMTLLSTGRLVLVKGNDFQSINLKQLDESLFVDGKRILIQPKDLGSSNDQLYPSSIQNSPNGRYLGILDTGEQYSILLSQALRVKQYGNAHHFAWIQPCQVAGNHSSSPDKVSYATALCSDYSCEVSLYNDEGTVLNKFIPPDKVTGLYGNGPLLGVAHSAGLSFYHPQSLRLIAKVTAEEILGCYWENADNNEAAEEYYYAILTDTRVLIYKYRANLLEEAIKANLPESDDGLPEAFLLVDGWVQKQLTSGLWIGKAFVYSTEQSKIYIYAQNYHFEFCNTPGSQFLLAYLPFINRVISSDRDYKITSFWIDPLFIQLLSVLDSLSAASADDKRYTSTAFLEALDELMAGMKENFSAHAVVILRNCRMAKLALKYATNPETKFRIALSINDVETAADLLRSAAKSSSVSESLRSRWTEVGHAATDQGYIDLAVEAYTAADDMSSLALLALSLGDSAMMKTVAKKSAELENNTVNYLASYLLRDHVSAVDLYLKENRYAEAAMYARAFCPDRVADLAALWADKTKLDVNTVASWEKQALSVEVGKQLNDILSKYQSSHYLDYVEVSGYDFLEEYENLGEKEFVAALMAAPEKV